MTMQKVAQKGLPYVTVSMLLGAFFWFFTNVPAKKDVEKIEAKFEKKLDKDQERALKQIEIDTRQNIMIDELGKDIKDKLEE